MCCKGLHRGPHHGHAHASLHYATISLSGFGHPWNWHVHPWRWYCNLERWVVIHAKGFARSLFLCSFALATSFFANAIFVKSSLTLVRASTVLLPAGMLSWSAVTSCCAAATTWDSGEIAGLVMNWCLNTTVSLILVALVLITYTLKHWWCSMDVPRLKPGSNLVSHDRRSLGLTCVWTAHPISANGFCM
jgi:hypothetical protein